MQLVHIIKVDVERDDNGYWCHPTLPEDADEGFDLEGFLDTNGMESEFVVMEFDENTPAEVAAEYFEDGGHDISEWDPTPPEGEGWFLYSIFDSDDGPQACYVRPKTNTLPN